jgi:hypothetical protein
MEGRVEMDSMLGKSDLGMGRLVGSIPHVVTTARSRVPGGLSNAFDGGELSR